MRTLLGRTVAAALVVVLVVTFTGLGRAAAAFYATTANQASSFTSGSGFGVGALYEWGDAGDMSLVPAQVFSATTWSTVAAGNHVTCGIQTDASLWCSGRSNTYGQLGFADTVAHTVPARVGTATWSRVATGDAHTCGVQTDTTLWCWGYNADGRLGIGSTTNHPSPRQVTTPASTGWASVTTGNGFTCATRTDATLYCFGLNTSGELGNGTTTSPQLTPAQVTTPSATGWASVSAGTAHACGLRADQSLYCWGDGDYYKLGQGTTTTDSSTPLAVAGSWSAVSAGADHTCAIKANGTLYCWGAGGSGRLGSNDTANVGSPNKVGNANTWQSVSGGAAHTCGTRDDGTLWCWGNNGYGQVGVNDTTSRTTPVQVGTGTTWASLGRGSIPNHSCATKADGTLWCWGDPGVVRYTAQAVGTDTTWRSTAVGDRFTCGVQSAGSLWCWGVNTHGQLGLGDTAYRPAMVRVGTASTWKQVTAGQAHTCAVGTDTTLWCWGNNADGQLGLGNTTSTTVPAQLSAPSSTGWAAVAAGPRTTCATRTDGTLHCWGNNTYGQIGQGNVVTPRSSPLPVVTPAAAGWATVHPGDRHTCAVRTDRTLYCWGEGANGRLGQGNTTQSSTPLPVPGSSWWIVAAGQSHTCAIKTNGTLWCWGAGGNGRLGLGDTADSTSPAQVSGAQITWRLVTAGTLQSCAVRMDSTVWCWGGNGAGELGLGTSVATQTTPAQVPALTGRPVTGGPASGAVTLIVG
ncbi:MAG TPA: hypothetical protein VFR35_15805 [Actinoplanes sp.]|nr:hypothetical protein [Actinoplanes sp.]